MHLESLEHGVTVELTMQHLKTLLYHLSGAQSQLVECLLQDSAPVDVLPVNTRQAGEVNQSVGFSFPAPM